MTRKHIVVPYPASNSTVRVRALHWIDRAYRSRRVAQGDVLVHGPGFSRHPVRSGEPVLLLRNVRRLSRGRSERNLLNRASLGVYDLDDGLPWDDGRLPRLGRWWKRPFPMSLIASRAAEAADRIIAGNEVLAEWASGHCGDVRLIPTCVEPGEYSVRTSWDIVERPPLLGWIGSPATEIYLRQIAPTLVKVNQATGARLHVIGVGGPPPPALAPFTTTERWSPDATRTISNWDVGLMPLADGVYERAKCGYKLLQYAASGVPAVGSPIGVNRRLLAEMDGLSAGDQGEWFEALIAIIEEGGARRQKRAEQGLAVATSFSYEAWEGTWLDAVGW